LPVVSSRSPTAAGKPAALLSPGAAHTLLEWGSTRPCGPWALIAGAEGGFEPSELAELDFAEPVALGPHVLRIETAVEAASAALVQLGYARSGRA
jgi:16S rRNA U1498 N3-methylase RsmE